MTTLNSHTFVVIWVARLSIGALLLIGGLGKLYYMTDFRKIVDAYKLIPKSWTSSFALALAISECVCGSLLFVPRLSGVAGFFAAGLFGLFIVAISANLLRGRTKLACGCFGKRMQLLSWFTVLRNFALSGVAVVATGRLSVVPFFLILAYVVATLGRIAQRPKTFVADAAS